MDITEQIEKQAYEARVTMTTVLERAGVSRGSFYRAKRGSGKMLAPTVARLEDAIAELKAERSGCPT